MENKFKAVLKRLVEAKRKVCLVDENPGTNEEYEAVHAEYATIKELIALIYDIKVSVRYIPSVYDPCLDCFMVKNFDTDKCLYWEFYKNKKRSK